MNRFSLTLIFLTLLTSACNHDPVVPQSPQLTFENDIKAITLNNCAQTGCHDGHGEDPTLITYNDVMGIVKAGDANKSKLFKVITKLWGESAMPPSGTLSEDQIRTVYVWILQGAKEK